MLIGKSVYIHILAFIFQLFIILKRVTNEAGKEVIKLLGGVISGMNVGQPVIMQAANSEAQEPTEDVFLPATFQGAQESLQTPVYSHISYYSLPDSPLSTH